MSKPCCGAEKTTPPKATIPIKKLSEEKIKKAVSQGFSKFGASASIKDRPCCQKEASVIAVENRYTKEELASVPKEVVEVSAGCGNPISLIKIREGLTVLDLGCGGGIDVFLAANRIGPKGKAIGIDFALGMIERAREAAKKTGYENVEFILGDIEKLSEIEDGSVDVVISNCVINLAPCKECVYRQAFRVLKPGGILSVSDTTTQGDLPFEIRNNLDLWVKCLSGAIDEKKYEEIIRKAGFENIEIKDHFVYNEESLGDLLNIAGEEGDKIKELMETKDLPPITSSKFVAVKPKE